MPCSKGMTKCYSGCLHRAMVDDYRIARHAFELDEEAITIGDPEMISERRERGIRPTSFKAWLIGHARRDSH